MDNPVYFIDPDGRLSQSFVNTLLNSASGTKWTNNNGTFSSNTGEMTSTGEGSGSNNSSNNQDPPTTSSFKDFFKSLFKAVPRSNEEAKQSEVDREFFFDSTDLMIEIGENWQTAMTFIFPLPSNPSGEIKATGWITRKVYNSLDPTIASKFSAAISKGVVASTGRQGIIKLTASEISGVGGGYTHTN